MQKGSTTTVNQNSSSKVNAIGVSCRCHVVQSLQGKRRRGRERRCQENVAVAAFPARLHRLGSWQRGVTVWQLHAEVRPSIAIFFQCWAFQHRQSAGAKLVPHHRHPSPLTTGNRTPLMEACALCRWLVIITIVGEHPKEAFCTSIFAI